MIRRARKVTREQRIVADIERRSKLELQLYVTSRLRELRTLPPGWDGGSRGPISQRVTHDAYRMLDRISDFRTVYPFITPAEEGAVLLEWRAGVERLEIEFHPTEKPYVRHVSVLGDVQMDGVIGHDGVSYDDVRRALSALSSRIWVANPSWKRLFT
ncbi:hypothetical protein [Streptomyces sp. NBC_01803]|uniref:hypothetical protein n=1 Tax=Streptomyces sp. NBC_01803 TaxID=2975946 RepID=UPI002DDA5645|nr:hypothetical protein [Streptomyces sp. NBC_01803]WSA45112.1 hypothetical protein OIE51_13395 [Streptomyces sp. NBC_01803]